MASEKLRLAAVLMAAATVSSVAAQAPGLVWESVFDPPFAASPQIFYLESPYGPAPYSIQLTPAPDGDYHLHAPDWTGKATVSRVSALDDSIVWRRIVSGGWIYQNETRLNGQATEDGGALVVAGGVARFSADGEFLWSRSASAASMGATVGVHRLSDGDLLVQSGSPPGSSRASFSRIDATTGALIDGIALPMPSDACLAGLLGTDANDAMYLVTRCPESGQQVDTLSKLAPDHSVVWTYRVPDGLWVRLGDRQSVIRTDAVYVGLQGFVGGGTVRLSSADGSQSWIRYGTSGELRLDASGRLLHTYAAGSSHRVERLNPLDGVPVWTYDMAATDVHVDVAADGIYLAGAGEDRTYSVVERLDHANGSLIWRAIVPGTVAGGHFQPGAVLAATSAIRIAGADCSLETECRVGVLRIDRLSGTASPIFYPEVPQTARGSVIADALGGVLAYALEPVRVDASAMPTGQQVRVRRIDESGVVEWERVLPVHTLVDLDEVRVMRTGDGDLLLAVNTSRASMPVYGHPYIAKYSGIDGQLRWEKYLLSGLAGGVDFSVDSDAAGNVFLGESSVIRPISGGGTVHTRSISLLDAGTGKPQWTQPLRPGSSFTLSGSAPYFRTAGNDVLLFESPPSMSPGAIVRLSGTSGAVAWASAELATPGADLITSDAGEGFMRDAGNGVKAFSLASGTVRWTYRYVDPAGAGGGSLLWGVVGDDGDVYFSGSRANGSGWTARVARDSGVPVWAHHFDAAVGAVQARAIVRDAAQGYVHVTQRRGAELFLTRLDQQTGAFVDSSLLSRSPIEDEAIPDDGALYLRRMANGQILAPGTAYRPGEASRPWVGRLAAPSAGARGNLALSLTVSPAAGTPAETRTLTMPIAYSGDGAISDVVALVALDTAATGRNDGVIVDALECAAIGGGHCSAVTAPTGIRLQLDMAPGATATLTAQLRAVASSSVISAKVYARYGLFESDMRDNEASVQVSADRLFADDFE